MCSNRLVEHLYSPRVHRILSVNSILPTWRCKISSSLLSLSGFCNTLHLKGYTAHQVSFVKEIFSEIHAGKKNSSVNIDDNATRGGFTSLPYLLFCASPFSLSLTRIRHIHAAYAAMAREFSFSARNEAPKVPAQKRDGEISLLLQSSSPQLVGGKSALKRISKKPTRKIRTFK